MPDFDPLQCWSCVKDTKAFWIVYEHGTCVSVDRSSDDPKSDANEILRQFGPVHGGSPAGDFGIYPAPCDGWIVTSHHENVNTFVAPDEVETKYPAKRGLYIECQESMQQIEGLAHCQDIRRRGQNFTRARISPHVLRQSIRNT